MYGLPAKFDVSGFVGKSLEVMVVGQYQLTLSFSEKYVINIEGQISIDSEAPVRLPDSLSVVYPLINQTIESASASENGTLIFKFGNNATLHILDSESQFESYNFSMGGQELFVV